MFQKNEKGLIDYKIPIGILLILVIGGYISNGIDNIFSYSEVKTSLNPLHLITYNLKNQIGLVLVSITTLLIYLKKKKEEKKAKNRNFSYSEKGTFGTSSEMTDKEFDHYLKVVPIEESKEILLGEIEGNVVCLKNKEELKNPYNKFPLNRNIAISGAPGKGKSFYFGLPFIFQLIRKKESGYIFDPKGEYYERTASLAKKAGFTIKVICFKTGYFKYSDGWDCLQYIMGDEGSEERASEIVSIIMNSTQELGSKGNQFFTDGVKNLLAAGLLYVANSKSYQGKRDIGSCFDFLSQTPLEIMKGAFESLPKDDTAKKKWNLVNGSNAINDIVTNLGTRLSIFGTREINSMLSANEIDVSLPGKIPCMYYVVVDDQSTTYNALSSIFATTAIKSLTDLADSKADRVLDVPTWFLFEEFPSSVTIPDIEKKLATGRSRQINFVLIYQNLAQMQNKFPYGRWEDLLSLCDININLGLGSMDLTTSSYISRRTGDATIDIESRSEHRSKLVPNTILTTMNYGLNESESRRKVMNEDEVLKMQPDELLLLISGHNVKKLKKYNTLKHPMFKYMKEIKIQDHIPKWKVDEKEREAERLEKLKQWEEEAKRLEEEKANKKKKVISNNEEKKADTKQKQKKRGRPPIQKEVTNYGSTLLEELEIKSENETIEQNEVSKLNDNIVTIEGEDEIRTVDANTGEILSIKKTKRQEDKLIKEILGDQLDDDYFED